MNYFKVLERIDPDTVTFLHRGTLLQHIERYEFSKSFCKNKKVLDAACGTGYGSVIISKVSKEVTGIDISEKTILENKTKFNQIKNLSFVKMSVTTLDFPDNYFDVITSFETIEHIKEKDINLMLKEFSRVLKKDGLLIISTPDVRNYSLDNFIKSNGFHLIEFDLKQFEKIINLNFKIIDFYYQDKSLQFFRIILSRLSKFKFLSLILQKIWRALKSIYFYQISVLKYSKEMDRDFVPMYNLIIAKNEIKR